MTDELTKVCTKCGRELPLSEFTKHKSRSDGLQAWCKSCRSERNKTRDRTTERKNTKKKEVVVKIEPTYPNDPLRVNPEHKEYISESGVYVYSDTCVNCEAYSAFYGGCRIRESSDNQSVVKRASVPMSVSAGEKCKLWRAK
jgi:hypothetical protein